MAKTLPVMTLQEILTYFKARENNLDALPVLGDEVSMRVLAAMSKVQHTWNRPSTKMPPLEGNGARAWKWLVTGWGLSRAEVATAANVSLREASDRISLLCANHLVYPDGTLSKASLTAMNVHISRVLGVRQKSAAKDAAATGDAAQSGRSDVAEKKSDPGAKRN